MEELDALLGSGAIRFEEAESYFGERVPVKASVFYKISEEYRGLAFTVGGYTKAQILNRFYEELLGAITEGTTILDFRRDMGDFLEAEGYEGPSPVQADNIFRTNIQTAYNVGHYEQMTEPESLALRPYWQYNAVNDRSTRDSHLLMDGRVYPADSPIWDTWYPPNGFRCRCTVSSLSERQVKARGLEVERGRRVRDVLPDPQFGSNPAKQRFVPNMEGYPEPLVKAYRAHERKNPTQP